MQRQKMLGVAGTLTLICGLVVAPGSVAAAGKKAPHARPKTVLRIGALVDQTGASTSPLYTSAVELAVSQMNQALERSRSRYTFEVVFADTKSTPALAQSEAVRLINEEGVLGLVSDTSGDTVAVNKLNYDPASPALRKVPITCFQCSSGFINDPNVVEVDPLTQAAERDLDNWLFRIFYNAKYEAAVQVQLALQNTNGGVGDGNGNLKIGILADAGHKSLAVSMVATLPSFYTDAASTEIVYMSSIAGLPADWAKVVDNYNQDTGLTDGPPDVVVMAMLPGSAAEGMKVYDAAGYPYPIQSNNSFRRNYILDYVGDVANGLQGSSVALVNSSRSGELFSDAFEDFTGQPPELTSSGAYDCAATLMLAALAAGGGHRPAEVTAEGVRLGLTAINQPHALTIRPAVRSFQWAAFLLRHGWPINYDGAYNADDWDAAGDIFPPLVHWSVENAQFVEYEAYLCDPANPLCPVAE